MLAMGAARGLFLPVVRFVPVSGFSGTLCVFTLADRCFTPCLVVPHPSGIQAVGATQQSPARCGAGPCYSRVPVQLSACHLSGCASPLATVF
eukprot:8006767-Pyramimonas_sp.AAC.1